MEGLEAGLEDSKAGREISAWDSLLAGGRTWPWPPAGDTLYRWLFFYYYYFFLFFFHCYYYYYFYFYFVSTEC